MNLNLPIAFAVLMALSSLPSTSALAEQRQRVLVSTDIGGTDPDDMQSMAHLLLYADVLDIEGLLSSPFGAGRTKDILDVIDCYARDYGNLKTYSDRYPTPEALRAIAKQGEKEVAPYAGVRRSTEGSEWIVKCARRDDPRPLHVLIWGGIEDLAQALHDAPDILPKLRVYYIGGPNKKWTPDAYQYIADHFPALWMIENNSTYRGWFVGGNQSGEWGNQEFVTRHVAGHGALGDYFATRLEGTIKMGDTPSVAWLIKGTPDDPSKPSWGGQFVRAWERPYSRCDRLPAKDERMEVFGILELVLPLGADAPKRAEAHLIVENQEIIGHAADDGTMRFRFCPKEAKAFAFTIRSTVPSLNGKTGGITAVLPSAGLAQHPSPRFPNWWTDDPSPEFAEGRHHGAKTVSRWREEFLRDFAARMDRCAFPAHPEEPATHPDRIDRTHPIVLASDGSGEVSRLEDAVKLLSDFRRTIIVRPGTYFPAGSTAEVIRFEGSRERPAAIVAENPERPPVFDWQVTGYPRKAREPRSGLIISAPWWIVDGLVLQHAEYPLYLDAAHLTVRRCVIRRSAYDGLMVSRRHEGFIRIENCRFEEIGTPFAAKENTTPRHAIYYNAGSRVTGSVIARNSFAWCTGAAIQIKAQEAYEAGTPAGGIYGLIVEDNVAFNCKDGINLYFWTFDSVFRGNRFLFNATPEDLAQHNLVHPPVWLQLRSSGGNRFENNEIWINHPGAKTIIGYQTAPGDPDNDSNVFVRNRFATPAGRATYGWNQRGAGMDAPLNFSEFAAERKQTLLDLDPVNAAGKLPRSVEELHAWKP